MTSLRGKNKSYYNYLLKYDGKVERFHILNKKNKRKWLDFEIIRIKEPVFINKIIDYTDSEDSD